MKLTLKWRLILSVGLSIFVVLALSMWISIQSIKDTQLEAIQERAEALVNPIEIKIQQAFSYHAGSIEAVASRIPLECQRLISSTMLSHCSLMSVSGKFLIHHDPNSVGGIETNPEVLEAIKSDRIKTQLIGDSYNTFIPVLDPNKQHVGTIRLGFSKSLLDIKIRKVSLKFGLLLVILWGGVLLVGSLLIQKTVNEPVQQLISITKEMAAGNISERVPVKGNDEISQLGIVFNLLINHLQHIIKQVQSLSDEMNRVSGQLVTCNTQILQGSESQKSFVVETALAMAQMDDSVQETTENIKGLLTSAEDSSSSIMELRASIEEIAANTENLSASVEETVSSLEEMNISIKEIASSVKHLSSATESTASFTAQIDALIKEVEINAGETARLSEKVTHDAEVGTQSVRQTIGGIQKIQEVTNQAVDVISRLSEKAEKIGEILNVIDDVADKTNLLALNAAIIAAQAGEHGKGFAVVADEIKDLAEKTTASTKEIADLIEGVQSETNNAVSVIHIGLEQVQEGVRLANEAGTALTEILNSSKQATDMAQHIAQATSNQTKGSKQIKEALDNMVEMVEQITRATQEQSKGSGQIVKATETMKDMTHQVKRATQEQFKGSDRVVHAVEDMQNQATRLFALTQLQKKESERVINAMESIKKISHSNIENITQLNNIVETLIKQISLLSEQIARFKVEG